MKSTFRTDVAAIAVILMSACLVGCGGKSPGKTKGETKSDGVAKTVANPLPKGPNGSKRFVKLKPFDLPDTVDMKEVTPKELQDFIEKQKGRVVLVDYWFVDCQPCQKALPHTIALGKRHAKDGLLVVTMCVDSRENRSRAIKFLESKDAKLVNFYPSSKQDIDPEKLPDAFAVPAFPLYRLYGPDGKLIESFSPADADIEKFLTVVDAAVKEAIGR